MISGIFAFMINFFQGPVDTTDHYTHLLTFEKSKLKSDLSKETKIIFSWSEPYEQ